MCAGQLFSTMPRPSIEGGQQSLINRLHVYDYKNVQEWATRYNQHGAISAVSRRNVSRRRQMYCNHSGSRVILDCQCLL